MNFNFEHNWKFTSEKLLAVFGVDIINRPEHIPIIFLDDDDGSTTAEMHHDLVKKKNNEFNMKKWIPLPSLAELGTWLEEANDELERLRHNRMYILG